MALRVLQLASYNGNIGDNANVLGARRQIKSAFQKEVEFTDLEIRDFFRKEKFYDKEFATYVNSFDLFIFGGGNFFELWVDSSCNNTSVDIPVHILEEIKTPIVFYALGLDAGMGFTDEGLNKFKNWLDYVVKRKDFFLSLRNDGSLRTAYDLLGKEYAKHFHKVPDGGFFANPEKFINHPEIQFNADAVIGMNLAGDMLDMRFAEKNGQISYIVFLKSLANLFNELFDSDERIYLVLYPHIFKDLRIIYDFLSYLNDKYARSRVTVAPYLTGFNAYNYVFDSYRRCQLIIGNRFHTNVCAIGMNIPTIGFSNYPQIKYLYEEIGLLENCVTVNKFGFQKELMSKILHALKNIQKIKSRYAEIYDELFRESAEFHNSLALWYFSLRNNSR